MTKDKRDKVTREISFYGGLPVAPASCPLRVTRRRSNVVGGCNFCRASSREVFVVHSEVQSLEVRFCPGCVQRLLDQVRYG